MKYYLVTYKWQSHGRSSWKTENRGAATECLGQWWIELLKDARDAVEKEQLARGRTIKQINWDFNQDCRSETYVFLHSVEITEAGYDALEEAEIGH